MSSELDSVIARLAVLETTLNDSIDHTNKSNRTYPVVSHEYNKILKFLKELARNNSGLKTLVDDLVGFEEKDFLSHGNYPYAVDLQIKIKILLSNLRSLDTDIERNKKEDLRNKDPKWMQWILLMAAIVAILTYFNIAPSNKLGLKNETISQTRLENAFESKNVSVSGKINSPSIISPVHLNEQGKIENVSVPAINHCPSENDIKLALTTADQAFSNDARDDMLNKIVDGALCQSKYDLALVAVGRIFKDKSKDFAYMKLIKKALEDKSYDVANKASNMIFYDETKDRAKQLIVEALSLKN
jgi:hypothetical protein